MGTALKFAIGWIAAAVAFAILSVLAGTHDTFPGDVWLAHRIQDIDLPGFEEALDWAEDAADLPVIALVTAVVVAFLLLFRDGIGALIVGVAVPGRVLITWALKELIERPRPSAGLLNFESQPDSFSFPSGHAGAAFVLYGLIIYLAAMHISDLRIRLPVQAASVLVIVLVGVERIYVGHHWPSDVLGGYCIGALIVAAFIALHQIFARAVSNQAPQHSFTRAAPKPEPE